MITPEKNYWSGREVSASSMSRLKRFPIVRYLFSVRSNNYEFLFKSLKSTDNIRSILDVACGAGQEILVDLAQEVIGVDILGYPQDLAKRKGYSKTLVWGDLFSIPTENKFDAVTIINLNAHIPFEKMALIINSFSDHLQKDAKIVFINEFNNNNILYKLMKKDKKQFEAYVNGCEHFFFHYEEQWTAFIGRLGCFDLIERRVLSGNPSFYHFLAARQIRLSKSVLIFCLLADIVVSMINNIFPYRTGYLVGYVYKHKKVTSIFQTKVVL